MGNDWEAFRRQITAGLGMQAAGIPWWTYDAGGFFRPRDQYDDPQYIERMLRWIETSIYLPLMRVHGYMSNTEPWNYGKEAQDIITECLYERYRIQPYVYSLAAAVTYEGSTMMRPLVFDFPDDLTALHQDCDYMFGKSLLISPVTKPGVTSWQTYLPKEEKGWYDYKTGACHQGGQVVTTDIDKAHIPVFVRGGSILPLAVDPLLSSMTQHGPMEIRVYPGSDATFTLYEDDGWSNDYENGACSRITFTWDEQQQQLTIGKREGEFVGMPMARHFQIRLVNGEVQQVVYRGEEMKVRLGH